MTQNICILGIDHEVQVGSPRYTIGQNAEFKKLLQNLVSEHNIKFVGEETMLGENTVARSLASSLNIRWEPIEMSRQARQALGIADEQRYQRQTFDDISLQSSKQKRVLSDGIREEYMLWRTLTMAGESVENILVLCGFIHVGGLEHKFKKAGCQVRVDSLCKYNWYVHPDCV